MRKDGVQRQLESAHHSRYRVLAFRVHSRACPSGRVRPIFISRSDVSKLATLFVRFTIGHFEGFYSAKLGHRIRPNVESEYGSSLPPPGMLQNTLEYFRIL